MKSNKIITILFLLTLSLSNYGQTYKVQSVTKGIDFNEYSSSNRNYLERVIEVIKNSNITVKEGDLAIVSMKDGGMNFIFRFYKSANMFAMSPEDYLKVTEFNGTSNFINGISYIEMSVVRNSNVITSGEIRFYPDKYSKQAFTVKFLSQNKTSSLNNKNSNNTLSAKEDNTKQRLVFVNIEHVASVDYESVNDFRNYFFESEIKISESDEEVLLEMKNTEKCNVEWKFFRVFEGDHKTDVFFSMPDKSGNVRKLVLTKYSDKIVSVEIGCYQKGKEGAIYIVYLSASKTQTTNDEKIIQINESVKKASFNKPVKRLNYSTKTVDTPNSKAVKIKSKFEVVKFTIVDPYYSFLEPLYFKTILFENEDETNLYYEEYDDNGNEVPSGSAGRERYHFNGENYFKFDAPGFDFLTFVKDKSGKIVSAKIELTNDSLKTHYATIFLKKL